MGSESRTREEKEVGGKKKMKPLLMAIAGVLGLISCEIDAEISVDATGLLDEIGLEDIPDAGEVNYVEEYDDRDLCREACDRMGVLGCVAMDSMGRPGGYDICKLEAPLDYECVVYSNSCAEATKCFYGNEGGQ